VDSFLPQTPTVNRSLYTLKTLCTINIQYH
jgi:hypothetical protein